MHILYLQSSSSPIQYKVVALVGKLFEQMSLELLRTKDIFDLQ